MARALRECGVRWFEEPTPTEDRETLLALRPHVHALGMELIGGELLYGVAGFLPYLAPRVFDLIMPDVKHCGGIGATLAIAATADACGIAVAPHNPSGPISMAASAHVAAAMPRLRALSTPGARCRGDPNCSRHASVSRMACTLVPTGPGLGVDLASGTRSRTCGLMRRQMGNTSLAPTLQDMKRADAQSVMAIGAVYTWRHRVVAGDSIG